MDTKKTSFSRIAFLTLILLLSGCALSGVYGTLRQEYASRGGMDVKGLQAHWKDYHILYAGGSTDNPVGILFDPKKDDRVLKGDKWTRVEDEETMNRVIGWLDFKTAEYRPHLYSILGPDNHLFGYIYTFHTHVVTKAVDDRTLYVMDLHVPTNIRRTPIRK